LEADLIAASARAGQFVMLRFGGAWDPFLPRPMSISDVLPPEAGKPGRIQVLHKIVGRGTDRLARLRAGENLQVLGPLGRPFEIPAGTAKGPALMVAGGIGVAIFPFLVGALQRAGLHPILLFGARGTHDLVRLEWFASRSVETRTATEDGSHGRKGLVTDLLKEAIQSSPGAIVYACGPHAMLEATSGVVVPAGIPAQLSLESYMGCGIGACLGCVVKSRTAEGWAYRRICVDGPTFAAAEILWR
ncbi:MAG TPA: dihydroorotate dehydrogenase electron transfer subunit, partial [Candidatus Polarisedimenticolia bacterium]|nr:dihydroorotate dehydrogenase electron transfer subunit [Candidatus Polarisedimenticolia bacterium]